MNRLMLLTLVLALGASRAVAETPVAAVDVQGGLFAVRPVSPAESISVTVTGPQGYVTERTFGREDTLEFALARNGASLVDGLYLYEVRLSPATAGGHARVQSGGFHVEGGAVVVSRDSAASERGPAGESATRTPEDHVFVDDVIVQGRLCTGVQCVSGEPFGSESLKLKQLTNAIFVEDVSTEAGFPNADWRISFNDDLQDGLDRFAVDYFGTTSTFQSTPLSILGGAPSNSLFVDNQGRVGLGTAAPVEQLHVVGINPTLRLQEGGASPSTWDVSANTVNFFVRQEDATIPLRIGAGAPTGSIHVDSTGRVGLGTTNPLAKVHVRSVDASTGPRLLVEEAGGTPVARNMMRLVNNGASTFRFDNSVTGQQWGFGSAASGNFFMSSNGQPGLSMTLTPNGNLTIPGLLTQGSDRNGKHEIEAVDAQAVLERVAELPVATWKYKADESGARHIGPMAQDFAAAFAVGVDDKHLAPSDMGGVALAAIQALKRQVDDKDAQLRALSERLAALEARRADVGGCP